MRHPWRYRLQGALLTLLALLVAVVIHYWVGGGLWTYLGHRPRVFDMGAASEYRLSHPREDLPGLQNFAQVSRNLYRGAGATKVGYAALKALGVRTVVDLRELNPDPESLRGLGLWYVHIPMNPAEIDDDEVAQFLRIARNPDHQPLFVHCKAGSDRTGLVVAVYRVMEQGWPVEQAALELPNFSFHEVFQPLLHYLKQLDQAHLNSLAATVDPPVIAYIE